MGHDFSGMFLSDPDKDYNDVLHKYKKTVIVENETKKIEEDKKNAGKIIANQIKCNKNTSTKPTITNKQLMELLKTLDERMRVLIKKQVYINNNQANINNKNENRIYCLFDMCRNLEKQNKIKDIVILANTIGLLLFTIIMFVGAML